MPPSRTVVPCRVCRGIFHAAAEKCHGTFLSRVLERPDSISGAWLVVLARVQVQGNKHTVSVGVTRGTEVPVPFRAVGGEARVTLDGMGPCGQFAVPSLRIKEQGQRDSATLPFLRKLRPHNVCSLNWFWSLPFLWGGFLSFRGPLFLISLAAEV